MKRATDIAARLRDLEEAGGYTHAQLGELAGRLVNAVSEWTLGKRPPPDSALERIAARLDLPISVFEEGGPMPSALLRRRPAPRPDARLTPSPHPGARVTGDLEGRSAAELRLMLRGAIMGGARADRLLELLDALDRAIEREKGVRE